MEQVSAKTRIHELAEQMPVERNGIRLRMLEARDAVRYSIGVADEETARWGYVENSATSPEIVAEQITGTFRDDAERGYAVRFAIADSETDDYLGLMAFFDDQGDSVEIGFMLTPDSRGKGVAQGALAATALVAERAGYTSLRARTAVGNAAAHRTLERAGYRHAGDPQAPISEGLEGVLLQPFVKPLGVVADEGGGTAADTTAADLQTLFDEQLAATGIPGAQAVIIHRGTVYHAAGGVLNVRTGLEVTDESIFQIGSVTKLFTTVLALQLVDDGLIDLEDRVVDHLPEFQLADPEHAAQVRIIDLLQHRGGFDGDFFHDTGRGSDAMQKLVAELVTSQSFFRPGEQFAYSNAGMVVVGRLIEVKRGDDYLNVVKQRIYEPLGLEQAVTLPEEAILHGAAVGHTRDGKGGHAVLPVWQLPMSAAATGAVLTMSADNLARFGDMLLCGGTSRDGARILSPEMARLMGERAFSLPVAATAGEGMAVGALTHRFDGATSYGHDGHSINQVTSLRIVTAADLVVAVTTNRDNTQDFCEAIIDFALRRFANARVLPEPEQPEVPIPFDPQFIAGNYGNHTMTAAVTVDDDGVARLQLGARSFDLGNQPPMRLHHMGDNVFQVLVTEYGVDLKFLFKDTVGDGVADFLWFNRILRREREPSA